MKLESYLHTLLQSTQSSSSELSILLEYDRNNLIEELHELRIKYVTSSTSFEIASEMERQANHDLDLSRTQVQGVHEEICA